MALCAASSVTGGPTRCPCLEPVYGWIAAVLNHFVVVASGKPDEAVQAAS